MTKRDKEKEKRCTVQGQDAEHYNKNIKFIVLYF